MWDQPEQLTLFEAMEDTSIYLKRKTGILSVCRQISEEALNVLYGCNLFILYIHGGAQDKLIKFGTANLQRIRHLRLVAQPMGVSYPETLKIDRQLWVPLLADLISLSLVAQQPLQARGYYNAPSLEDEMRDWVAWLEPILQYLAKNLARKTLLEVDHNDLAETSQLVQKFFPSGYHRAQTVTGDRIFMRGEYALESGYWDDDSGMNFADGGMGDDWGD